MATDVMGPINCTSNPDLQPNPDISGIGVLSGFFATAYFAFICCVAKSILDHKRSVDNHSSRWDCWSSALQSAIVSFGDQQVVTGISVIIAGFFQLQWGISVYHWQSVVNLAWLSTVTHLITLTALRDGLNEVRSNNAIRILRIISMGVLVLMLICAMQPVGYLISEENEISDSFPAWCLYHPGIEWHSKGKQYNWLYVALASAALTYSFLTRVLLLLSNIGFLPRMIGSILDLMHSAAQSLRRNGCIGGYKILRSLYTLLAASTDLYQSKCWEITWLFSALAWGSIRIFVTRSGYKYIGGGSDLPEDVVQQQNIWGFGQVIPLILLALPIFSFLEEFYSTRSNQNNQPGPALITFRHDLDDSSWYKKLVLLLFLLSIAVAADLLYSFPGGGAAYDLTNTYGIRVQIVQYVVWGAINFGILFVSTLVFLDEDLELIWNLSRLGIFLSRGAWPYFAWFIYFSSLVLASVFFDVIVETKGIPMLGI